MNGLNGMYNNGAEEARLLSEREFNLKSHELL